MAADAGVCLCALMCGTILIIGVRIHTQTWNAGVRLYQTGHAAQGQAWCTTALNLVPALRTARGAYEGRLNEVGTGSAGSVACLGVAHSHLHHGQFYGQLQEGAGADVAASAILGHGARGPGE